jgi:ribonuclease VapC
MADSTVLDASAILAFLQGEPGQETVKHALQVDRCVVSAANQAEVIAKALDRGLDAPTIQTILAELNYTVVDVTAHDGTAAGLLRSQTRTLGLSLGDRLCLVTAQRLKAKVLTADRPWLLAEQALGLNIVCIRPDAH